MSKRNLRVSPLLRQLARGAAALLCTAALAPAASAAWPNDKPIEVIVPYTPGGSTDTVTRIVMEKLSQRLGATVVVVNKPGANSTIGTTQLARSKPDGYTFGAILAAFAVNPHLYKLNYATDDFTTVSHIADLPLFLFVSTNVPANTVQELVEYGRKNPDALSYGSSGTGSSAHMTGANFGLQANMKMTHVPYKGSAPILADLLAGRVSMAFDPILVPMPHVKAGKLKVLALSSRQRWEDHPDIPTMEESGFPGFLMNSWVGLLAPKGTSQDIVDRVSKEIAEIVKDADVKQKFMDAGFVPVGGSGADLSTLIAHDTAMYGDIVNKTGTKIE